MLATICAAVDPICETCIAEGAGLKRQQDVNPITRGYASVGRLGRGRAACRSCGQVKKAVWADPFTDHAVPEEPAPWHWEGHVVEALLPWLVARGLRVLSVARTAFREQGPDVLARLPGGETLRVEAKGHQAPQKNATQMHATFLGSDHRAGDRARPRAGSAVGPRASPHGAVPATRRTGPLAASANGAGRTLGVRRRPGRAAAASRRQGLVVGTRNVTTRRRCTDSPRRLSSSERSPRPYPQPPGG